jgi:hypothetical protein
MEANYDKPASRDWLYFGISMVAIALLFAFADEWFWLALPFVLTYFVRAIRTI